MCVQVCCHLLSRPDNADSGSRISWRQTAECVAPGFRFRVQGPNLLSAPLFLDACLLRFPSDEGRADTPKHTHAHHQAYQTFIHSDLNPLLIPLGTP